MNPMETPTRFGVPATTQLVGAALGIVLGIGAVVLAPDFGSVVVAVLGWVGVAVAASLFIDAWVAIVAAEDEADRNANGEQLP